MRIEAETKIKTPNRNNKIHDNYSRRPLHEHHIPERNFHPSPDNGEGNNGSKHNK